MIHRAVLVLVLALGLETQLTRATEVFVNNTDGKLCLYANLMVNFSVPYEVTGDKNETAVFTLPDKVSTNGSSCGKESSTLKLTFGNGHSWTMSFSLEAETYQADNISFVYNLADSVVFPNATLNRTMSVNVTLTNSSKVGLNTCYSCKSQNLIQAEGVSQTLWNVLIQAFVNGSKSENITSCTADLPSTTTAAPTTTPTTAPTTTPTTTPSPPLPTPLTGDYNVTEGGNATVCLMAKLGLRVGFKNGQKYQEMNLEPNGTSVTGTCGVNSSELVLTNTAMTLVFTFANETNKFHLRAVNVTVQLSPGSVFNNANNSLTLWAASVGSSYMCNKEQTYNITESLTFYTFDLQVQPFAVDKGKFSTAYECSMDDSSLLIPIVVGVALAGLILIVVIAYVIGRRKTYVGYQTL